MIPYFRYGIDISRHHLKGIYVCSIGRNKRQSSRPPVGITCTLRETRDGDLTAGEPQEPGGPEYSPIALCYQGVHTILRPWNPYSCVIAAGVQNQFLHFPIRPRSRIFVLGCSLQTLSHLADILGPTGQLIGVMAADDPSPPSRAELGRFLRRHPQVWVVTEDIPQASLERYELLLSLPEACKHAFLMALHPRLGADSAAHALAGAKGSQKVLRRIFDFLEFPDAAKARCLVVCYCTPETRVAVIRDIVSSHVDILQRWRVPGKGTKDRVEGSSEHSGSVREDAEGKGKGGGRDGEEHQGPHWVLLDLPTDRLITNGRLDMESKLAEVVDDMKRLGSGLRTGLYAKEQLLLKPYFPNHALLLVKYTPHRDERRGGLTARRAVAAAQAGNDTSSAAEGTAKESGGSPAHAAAAAAPEERPQPLARGSRRPAPTPDGATPAPPLAPAAAAPSSTALPVPMFGGRLAVAAPGLPAPRPTLASRSSVGSDSGGGGAPTAQARAAAQRRQVPFRSPPAPAARPPPPGQAPPGAPRQGQQTLHGPQAGQASAREAAGHDRQQARRSYQGDSFDGAAAPRWQGQRHGDTRGLPAGSGPVGMGRGSGGYGQAAQWMESDPWHAPGAHALGPEHGAVSGWTPLGGPGGGRGWNDEGWSNFPADPPGAPLALPAGPWGGPLPAGAQGAVGYPRGPQPVGQRPAGPGGPRGGGQKGGRPPGPPGLERQDPYHAGGDAQRAGYPQGGGDQVHHMTMSF